MPNNTPRFGLLGWPVRHSVSPAMHNAAFEALGMDWRYELLPVRPEIVVDRVGRLAAEGFRGLNVTIPHKQAVIAALDSVSNAARTIGAVNTIVVSPHGGLHGDNTDWLGFLHPLEQRGCDLVNKRVLLLGAGGSARAVSYALAQRGAARIDICNRTPGRAQALADRLTAHFPGLEVTNQPALSYAAREAIELVVNTTPLGMWPNTDETPWPPGLAFPKRALVYDLVYRPEDTRFLQQAKDAGCLVQGGLPMLVVQGATSFEMWTSRRPPLSVMMAAAQAALVVAP